MECKLNLDPLYNWSIVKENRKRLILFWNIIHTLPTFFTFWSFAGICEPTTGLRPKSRAEFLLWTNQSLLPGLSRGFNIYAIFFDKYSISTFIANLFRDNFLFTLAFISTFNANILLDKFLGQVWHSRYSFRKS